MLIYSQCIGSIQDNVNTIGIQPHFIKFNYLISNSINYRISVIIFSLHNIRRRGKQFLEMNVENILFFTPIDKYPFLSSLLCITLQLGPLLTTSTHVYSIRLHLLQLNSNPSTTTHSSYALPIGFFDEIRTPDR